MFGSFVLSRISRMATHQEQVVKSKSQELFVRAQSLLRRMGAHSLSAQGLQFVAIDNNPRHGWISLGQGGAVEVVQRLGAWWVMPQRS